MDGDDSSKYCSFILKRVEVFVYSETVNIPPKSVPSVGTTAPSRQLSPSTLLTYYMPLLFSVSSFTAVYGADLT